MAVFYELVKRRQFELGSNLFYLTLIVCISLICEITGKTLAMSGIKNLVVYAIYSHAQFVLFSLFFTSRRKLKWVKVGLIIVAFMSFISLLSRDYWGYRYNIFILTIAQVILGTIILNKFDFKEVLKHPAYFGIYIVSLTYCFLLAVVFLVFEFNFISDQENYFYVILNLFWGSSMFVIIKRHARIHS